MADRGWCVTPPFSEPEVFDFPGRHRAGRVRERRARRGAADAALDSGEARHVQIRARHGVHRCTQDTEQAGLDKTEPVNVKGTRVSPRDVVAACLPDPVFLGDAMHGKTCAGHWVTGLGKDGKPREVYLYHVVDNQATMREYGAQMRGLADGNQSSCCSGAARGRHVVGCRRTRSGSIRCRAIPGSACGRLRLTVGTHRVVRIQLSYSSTGF